MLEKRWRYGHYLVEHGRSRARELAVLAILADDTGTKNSNLISVYASDPASRSSVLCVVSTMIREKRESLEY